MFECLSVEHQIKQNDKKMKELSIAFEALERQIDDFFNEVGVTPQQLKEYISNNKNFSESEWLQLNELREQCNEDIKQRLQHGKTESKKNWEDRSQIHPHWLFVR